MGAPVFAFETFRLDRERLELSRSGAPVALEPKPLELLFHLVRERDRVVPKRELIDALWPEVAVTEASLAFAIKQVRKALGDDARAPRFIQTQWGRGYRFVGDVREATPASAASSASHSLAVLPLDNLSDDREQGYFADGVTEDLIGELGKISALRVPSHRSVMRFKGSTEALPAIATELDVDTVIEGSVRRDGDQVRISVRLVDAASDQQLWQETYDEDLRDILALQSRIARSVALRVQVALAPSETEQLGTARPVVPAAYDAYLRARDLERTQRFWAGPKMVELLEKATSLDPDFSSAQLSLASAYYYTTAVYNGRASEFMPKARVCAQRAIERGVIRGKVTLSAIAACHDWDLQGAISLCDQVIEARPHSAGAASARVGRGICRCARGDRESGLSEVRHGTAEEPLDLAMRALLADYEARARRYDIAIEEAQALLRINQDLPQAHLALFRAHWWRGEIKEAAAARLHFLKTWELDPSIYPDVHSERDFREYVLVAIKIWEQRYKKFHAGAFSPAHFWAYLGEADKAFQWLERAYEDRDPELIFAFNMYPCFDPIRDDPRFAALADRVGVPIVDPDGPLVTPP